MSEKGNKKRKYKSGFEKRKENNKKLLMESSKNMHDISKLFSSQINQVSTFMPIA